MPVNHWKDGGFSAANGTAEADAAGRYHKKIKLMTLQTPFPRPTPNVWNGTECPGWPYKKPDCVPAPMWNDVFPGPNGTVHGFSAVCWYTGKNIFEKLGEKVPVGMMVGSVGGSSIELWLPDGSANNSKVCGEDEPPCDTTGNLTDSLFNNLNCYNC
jgi:hypothetical protein